MVCSWSWTRTGSACVGLSRDVALVERCVVRVHESTCGTGAVLAIVQAWELSDQNWYRVY